MAIFKLAPEGVFIPTYGGNDKEAKPVTFYHKAPSYTLRQDLLKDPVMTMLFTNEGKMDGGKSELKINVKELLVGMTTKIENLEVEVDGKKDTIHLTTVMDLYGKYAPATIGPMLDEVSRHYQDILRASEVDEKKSE